MHNSSYHTKSILAASSLIASGFRNRVSLMLSLTLMTSDRPTKPYDSPKDEQNAGPMDIYPRPKLRTEPNTSPTAWQCLSNLL